MFAKIAKLNYSLYMKIIILSLSLMALIFVPFESRAQMDPKAKAFLTVSGYGAAGGALLGVASMAFGTSSRAIAQGASLGLYAGLLFGTYVIVSHHQRTNRGSYDRSTPYDATDGYEGDYGEEPSGDSAGGGFFDSSYRAVKLQTTLASATQYRSLETKKGGQMPPITMNFVSISF